MKCIQILLLAAQAAMAQTETAAIQGTVVDAGTHKPIPAALVIASRAGAPPFARNTKSGGNGEFQVQGLQPGDYALCAQAEGDEYLDSCPAIGGVRWRCESLGASWFPARRCNWIAAPASR